MQAAASKRRKTEEDAWSGVASERAALGAECGEAEDDGAQDPELDDGLSKEERR